MSSALSATNPNAPQASGLGEVWQRFYAAAHARRRRYWSTRATRLPRPVVSVGNLHWGGSGKTPTTAALAAHLAARGLVVAVLSRGYKSTGKGIRVASRGAGLLLPVAEIGDEPALLATSLPGVAVVVAPDRAAAGAFALRELTPTPDVFLLDDGFSHLRLARDLDVLVFPSADPLGGERLWPQGRLREPLESARHASVGLVTGRQVDCTMVVNVARALARTGFAGELFGAPTVAGRAAFLAPGAVLTDHASPHLPVGTRVFLVSAIARPAELLRSVEEQGLVVVDRLELRDHFAYPAATCRLIEQRAATLGQAAGAADSLPVLTTAKDAVKLAGRVAVQLAVLPIETRPDATFWAFFDRWIKSRNLPTGRSLTL